MSANVQSSTGERAGRWLGRAWRDVRRYETRFIHSMEKSGLSLRASRPLLWILKLLVLVFLLYAVFWIAILLGVAAFAAYVAGHADLSADRNATEWRHGYFGFGQYNQKGERIDPYDPNRRS